jgi:DNA replicative helicase MCM subunit Mcm2 (Cdc46/Mcm family)
LTCADCGKDFQWSAKDQEFFAERDFQPPKRCKECRQARKQSQRDFPREGRGE